MELNLGYKQTDAGVIPDAWDTSSVGREFTIQLGKMLDAAKNTGVLKPYIGNRAVQWGRINLDDLAYVAMTPSDLQRFRLKRGDLLVCEGGEIGRAAIWNEPIAECYYQKALHRLRPIRGYDSFVMMCLLEFWTSSGHLSNYVTQTSIAHLPKDKFELVPLPIPPEPEQRAISVALSDVDKLIRKLDQLIAKKRDIKQAVTHELLAGRKRLPGFSGEWKIKQLGALGSTYGGLTGKTRGDFGVGAARYITFMNIMSNVVIDSRMFGSVRVSPSESQNRVMRGDLFFNGSSETPEEVGMCSVLLEDVENVYLNSFCFGFRLRDSAASDGLYLAYYLRSSEGRKLLFSLAQGPIRYNLSKVNLLKLKFPLPSVPEQRAIAAVLSDMDAEILALEHRRDKTRSLKQGMMQELLTGKKRLI